MNIAIVFAGGSGVRMGYQQETCAGKSHGM